MTDLSVFIMILLGSSIMLLGSVGLMRFPDVYSRIHALGVSSTLGIGCILLASFTFFCFVENTGSVKEIIIVVVLFLSSPVTVHLLSQTAYRRGIPLHQDSIIDELKTSVDEELV